MEVSYTEILFEKLIGRERGKKKRGKHGEIDGDKVSEKVTRKCF